MKKLVSITNTWGETIPLDKLDVLFVGDGYALATHKHSGFLQRYDASNGYTVITE